MIHEELEKLKLDFRAKLYPYLASHNDIGLLLRDPIEYEKQRMAREKVLVRKKRRKQQRFNKSSLYKKILITISLKKKYGIWHWGYL